MGYEVTYKYHERNEEGDYNRSEIKELKVEIGAPFEDISLDVLAQRIIAQMARRDIWILPDVEIHELKKQKINFRETKGGVIIKNKKFFLDNDSSLVSQEVAEVYLQMPETISPLPQQHIPSIIPQQTVPAMLQQPANKRPIKWVMLDHNGVVLDKQGNRMLVIFAVKQAGLKVTPHSRYPVFKEIEDPRDKRVDSKNRPVLDRRKLYIIQDDMKNETPVPTDYFVDAVIRLEGETADETQINLRPERKPKLLYEDEVIADMPDLRR